MERKIAKHNNYKNKRKKIRINQYILNYMELKILITDNQIRRGNSQWKVSQFEILDWGTVKFLKKHKRSKQQRKKIKSDRRNRHKETLSHIAKKGTKQSEYQR